MSKSVPIGIEYRQVEDKMRLVLIEDSTETVMEHMRATLTLSAHCSECHHDNKIAIEMWDGMPADYFYTRTEQMLAERHCWFCEASLAKRLRPKPIEEGFDL